MRRFLVGMIFLEECLWGKYAYWKKGQNQDKNRLFRSLLLDTRINVIVQNQDIRVWRVQGVFPGIKWPQISSNSFEDLFIIEDLIFSQYDGWKSWEQSKFENMLGLECWDVVKKVSSTKKTFLLEFWVCLIFRLFFIIIYDRTNSISGKKKWKKHWF